MNISTKYNLGDKIWLIQGTEIKEETIEGMHITVCPPFGEYIATAEKYVITVTYNTHETPGLYEHKEGISWWKSKEDLKKYLLNQLA